MNYLIVYKYPGEPNNRIVSIDTFEELAPIVEKLSKSGKGLKIDIYEASKLLYKLEYDLIPKTITEEVPKITLLP